MYNCLLCRNGYASIDVLARHVRSSHAREAKAAYRKGSWKMNDKAPSLFDAVDVVETTPSSGAPQGSVETPGQSPVDKVLALADELKVNIEVIPDEQPSFIEPKADLLIGATASGKTENIGSVADYLFLKYGKLTRLASTDPSGPGPLSGKVKAGT